MKNIYVMKSKIVQQEFNNVGLCFITVFLIQNLSFNDFLFITLDFFYKQLRILSTTRVA